MLPLRVQSTCQLHPGHLQQHVHRKAFLQFREWEGCLCLKPSHQQLDTCTCLPFEQQFPPPCITRISFLVLAYPMDAQPQIKLASFPPPYLWDSGQVHYVTQTQLCQKPNHWGCSSIYCTAQQHIIQTNDLLSPPYMPSLTLLLSTACTLEVFLLAYTTSSLAAVRTGIHAHTKTMLSASRTVYIILRNASCNIKQLTDRLRIPPSTLHVTKTSSLPQKTTKLYNKAPVRTNAHEFQLAATKLVTHAANCPVSACATLTWSRIYMLSDLWYYIIFYLNYGITPCLILQRLRL